MTECRCGAPLPPKLYAKGKGTPRGLERLWCSEKCRVRHYRLDGGMFDTVAAEMRTCLMCPAQFAPVRENHKCCSSACRVKRSTALRPKDPMWAAGQRRVRPVPCRDCGVEVQSAASVATCDECRSKRTRTTNRRKNAKRKGARVGIRYTLQEVGDRDGWKCHLCRRKVNPTLPGTAERGPTIDHLVPLSDDGADELENVALAHRDCNVKRRHLGAAQLRLTG